ncbi:hypothetical protein NDU88_005653 [Pleurodeles waltl]|uniref:Uncharacterized protein n=1 Tax=Pleurodeles waltl TaxID=8319 RepID=A0AAV7WYG6_PLEWA|nr:hypothetical protein NDU88_005653 [Pleurodeles waltl]
MEARCTALAVRVAKQKSRQKPKIPSAVQVRALVRKENWYPYTWDGTVSDNDDDWNWEDEVEERVAELSGVESGEGRVGGIEGERGSVMEVRPLVQNKSKGVNGGQIQNSRLGCEINAVAGYGKGRPVLHCGARGAPSGAGVSAASTFRESLALGQTGVEVEDRA